MNHLSQILLIDDEAHNREALSLLLGQAGSRVQDLVPVRALIHI